jgi:hypothetical protein
MSPPFASYLESGISAVPQKEIPDANAPFGIDVIQTQIRANISLLGTFPVLHGPAHAEMSPGVLLNVLDFEIFVARAFDYLLVV